MDGSKKCRAALVLVAMAWLAQPRIAAADAWVTFPTTTVGQTSTICENLCYSLPSSPPGTCDDSGPMTLDHNVSAPFLASHYVIGGTSNNCNTGTPVSLPTNLSPGQALYFDVSFSPARSGLVSDTLTISGFRFFLGGSTSQGSLGPVDGSFNSIAIDPSNSATLYVGTGAGLGGLGYSCVAHQGGRVFKSTNGGATWNEISSGLESGRINSLTIDGATGTLYAATSCGIFKTTDRGATWSAINSGLPPGINFGDAVIGMKALVVDPFSPATLYALTAAGGPIGNLGTGVYKTTNGGASWSPMNSGLPSDLFTTGPAESLAIDRSNPATLYLGVAFAGIFKTTNAGASWSDTGFSLPRPDADIPEALVIDPTNPAIVYFVLPEGVYKTTDGGASWSSVYATGHISIDVLAVDPTNPSTLYAGDGGAIPPYFAFRTDGVLKSTTGGSSFAAVSPFSDIGALAIDPAHTATVYAGGDTCSNFRCSNLSAALLKTTDGGTSWVSLTNSTPRPCAPDSQTLCLMSNRFAVTVSWSNQFNNVSGAGAAIPSTDSTGFFYFTEPSNYELIVKILNINGVIKVFYGELTDLHFTVTVTDTQTGAVKTYRNTPGDCGAIDENGFPGSAPAPRAVAKRGSCAPASDTLCLLDRRFAVTVGWMNQFNNTSGQGSPRSLSDQSGLFSFADPSDVELVMKAVDFGDRTAFFWGALSDFAYDIAVTDTVGGTTKTYHNPAGNYCGGLDNNAFPP